MKKFPAPKVSLFLVLLAKFGVAMDMARMCCNVFGNCIATVVAARWEREFSDEAVQLVYTRSYDDWWFIYSLI
jgi:Na+/H+-dicarboxylate symporter